MEFNDRLKEICRQVLGFLIRLYGVYLAVTSFSSMVEIMSLKPRAAAAMPGTSIAPFFSMMIGAALFVFANTLIAMTYRKSSEEKRAEKAASRS